MVRDGINIGEVCSGSDGTAVGAKLVLVESFGEVCSGSDGTAVGAKLVLVDSFGEVCSDEMVRDVMNIGEVGSGLI